MSSSGLAEAWVECGIFGTTTAENILDGKHWNRTLPAHKLTLEAPWRVLWPQVQTWASDKGHPVSVDMQELLRDISDGFKYNDTETIVQSLEEVLPLLEDVMELLKEYDNSEHAEDPTYTFWRQYMELVGILLRFTCAIRDGNWHLYKSSFLEMLPWFAALDHVNYMRWGIVYLTDM